MATGTLLFAKSGTPQTVRFPTRKVEFFEAPVAPTSVRRRRGGGRGNRGNGLLRGEGRQERGRGTSALAMHDDNVGVAGFYCYRLPLLLLLLLLLHTLTLSLLS